MDLLCITSVTFPSPTAPHATGKRMKIYHEETSMTFGDRNILYTLFARAREHEGLIQKKRKVNSKEPIPFFWVKDIETPL
jgi:hypothetical protein